MADINIQRRSSNALWWILAIVAIVVIVMLIAWTRTGTGVTGTELQGLPFAASSPDVLLLT